jgi:uracil-DNA glycosylase family protein
MLEWAPEDTVPVDPVHPALAIGPDADLGRARSAAAGCRACQLHANATQTVFGAGHERTPMMLVGEQPGDREDIEGQPFVGPAGRLLDEALDEAGIDRTQVYVSNVVKHFRWKPQGKRRLHEKPGPGHIRACRPWLDLELDLVRPQVLVMLGATAAQALLGRTFKVTERRGELMAPLVDGGPRLIATYHPSAILRARTPDYRALQRQALVDDLSVAAGVLAG